MQANGEWRMGAGEFGTGKLERRIGAGEGLHHRPIWLSHRTNPGASSMPQTHIVTAFDQELDRLTSSIGAMGDFAGAQLTDALRRDLSASAALVIAKRQPLAGDLDEVLADFKIVEDLERIGDLAKNIA